VKIPKKDIDSLMLCIAGAWLYGTISRGRAHELAKALGKTAKDVDDLKFVEERLREAENHCNYNPHSEKKPT
jgi:hypothetical protein